MCAHIPATAHVWITMVTPMPDLERLEAFIAQYPVYEYRILNVSSIGIFERVRTICQTECERYGTTWACPPAVGTIPECEEKIRSYDQALFFSSVAEVSDLLNMDEMLTTRRAHEEITADLGKFLEEQGLEIYILSTESCDICEECTYPKGKPCRFPERMHPCLESHGVMVYELVTKEHMEYELGGNTILWFSLILFRKTEK